MDPDTCLEEIRRILKKHYKEKATKDDYILLGDLIDGLDHWMSGGSYLPRAWMTYR